MQITHFLLDIFIFYNVKKHVLYIISQICFTFCCKVDKKEHVHLSGNLHPFAIPQPTTELQNKNIHIKGYLRYKSILCHKVVALDM